MAEGARTSGFPDVTERLVTDWGVKGLIAQGKRAAGGGGGPGASYEWSDEQFRFFLILLAKRRDVRAVAPLCDLPVGNWLYFAVDWIEVDQVRRAVKTWWKRTESTNWKQALHQARIAMHAIAPRGSPLALTNALRDALAKAMYTKHYDVDEITGIVRQLVERKGAREHMGAFWQPAEKVVEVMLWQVDAMTFYDDVTDGMFLNARARLRPVGAEYIRQYAELRSLPRGERFEEPTMEHFMTSACRSMVTALGQELRAARGEAQFGPVVLVESNTIPVEFKTIPISPTNPQRIT
jgi:hypothetical protein